MSTPRPSRNAQPTAPVPAGNWPSWGEDWRIGLRVWVERGGQSILGPDRLELLEGIDPFRPAPCCGRESRRGGRTTPERFRAAGNGTSNILIVWDHGKTPGCADSSHAATALNPRGPWPFPDTTNPKSHYPDQRHTKVFNVLYCDGHAGSMTHSDLTQMGTSLFLANGAVPSFP